MAKRSTKYRTLRADRETKRHPKIQSNTTTARAQTQPKHYKVSWSRHYTTGDAASRKKAKYKHG